jgi:hypothetical protein
MIKNERIEIIYKPPFFLTARLHYNEFDNLQIHNIKLALMINKLS